MKKTILPDGIKDETGAFTKAAPLPVKAQKTFDELLLDGHFAIERIMHSILKETQFGVPDRDVVMTLKDCMTMLHELKKKEKEYFESLSDEELALVDNTTVSSQK